MSRQKERREFSANSMRLLLSASLVLILLGMGGGFYMAYSKLKETAADVAETQSRAKSSDSNLQYLIGLQAQLTKHKASAEKANQIVAESQSYQYQNQIINDLTRYASQAGVSITSFTFQDAATPKKAAGNQSTSTTNQATTEQGGATTAAPSIKSTIVSIQLSNDLIYKNLLHFIYLIEQNLTRMQISDLSLSRGEGIDSVSAQTLNVEVYIR